MHVVLVQVGHRRDEPALHGLFLVHIAGIWVKHWGQTVARLQETGAARVAGPL